MSPQLDHFAAFTALPTSFFRTIGVTAFHPRGTSQPSPVRRRLQFLWFGSSALNTALCVLGECIYLCLTFARSDFVELTSLVLCIGFIMLGFVKIGTILWQRQQLDAMMARLHELCPRRETAVRQHSATAYVAEARRLQRIYAWIQMAMIWLFNCYPLLTTVLAWAGGGPDAPWELDFPYVIWYPFDPYGRGWFELNYVSQMWAAYFSATGILAADLLLCGVVVQLCMHYDRLAAQMRSARPDGQRQRQAKADWVRLTAAVRQHDTIMALSVQLDAIFGVCVLFNLVSSIVILCVLAFLVVTAGVSVALVKYALTLVTCTGQIYMVCLLGEKCVEASMGIASGAWEGEWYGGDRRYRRGVLMMLLRGSRPQCLTAYKFSVASMRMFSSVMSTAWQFFAVLRSAFEQ